MTDNQASQDNQDNPGMDDFTRKYFYFLVGLVLVGFIWWLSSLDFRAMEINDLLEADADVAAYPYPFRVISLKEGVAQLGSPRSAQFSAIQALRIMYPDLKKAGAVSDEMMAAQDELARVQSHVGKLVKSQEDVNSVRWVLDQQWLTENGAQFF
tara:strand:- start:307 stop:768 length:462 start_codon:yes stop_codon:yes gene_type:complete